MKRKFLIQIQQNIHGVWNILFEKYLRNPTPRHSAIFAVGVCTKRPVGQYKSWTLQRSSYMYFSVRYGDICAIEHASFS